ncbi:fimbrial protein [Salmonella enterica]|nr:fimbrial protein [Citrobacter werkmanii]EHG1308583.1 fimbrial protein [Salmonella enterica]EHH6165075.1 fimbrial protein [Salmonella enterica]EHO7416043.1 fimbrial protein [Salmonella enterica]EHP0290040.1 fimbrial protein [Salmonella enterica]
MTRYGKPLLLLLTLMIGLAPELSLAVSNQTGDSVTFKFTGRLQAVTPCSINNDKVITVEFGNSVAVNRVESGSYVQEVKYILDCGSAGDSNTVSMVFKAISVPSDRAVFASDAPGLWVKVLKDGQPLTLNEAFTVANPKKPPVIEVLLVKDPESDLREGNFHATGTLMAEYL